MVTKLLIDLVSLMIALFIGLCIFLWLFFRRYSEDIRKVYEKLEEYEREKYADI